MYGRENLLAAQRKSAQLEKRSINWFNDIPVDRQSLLGALVTRAAIERAGVYSGIALAPSNENQEMFRQQFDLPDSYNVNALRLGTKNDNRIKRVNFQLGYILDSSGEGVNLDVLENFSASEHPRDAMGSATNLNMMYGEYKQRVPVEFESDEYRFIRGIGGLFLPEIMEQLEAEGL